MWLTKRKSANPNSNNSILYKDDGSENPRWTAIIAIEVFYFFIHILPSLSILNIK